MAIRRGLAGAALVALALAVMIARAPASPAASAAVPALDHVFVIVMENHSYSAIIGSSTSPYVNGLLPSAGLGVSYYAITHPSLPNYLAMVGGSTYGIASDCTTCWVSAPNIADSLEARGSSWKAYMESMPSACFVGDSYPYMQKHNPFIYFNNIRTNASRCQSHVVPYTQLAADLRSASTTPNYAYITPNMCNDTHDCSIATGDAWLKQQVPTILASPAFKTQRSLLVLTWDEDDSSGTNQIPLLLMGSGVVAGLRSSITQNHYSLLHTIEVARGLATLTANDAGAGTMSDFFAATPVPPPPPIPGGPWTSIGGTATSDPGAASAMSGHVDAFARGADKALRHRAWNGNSWQPWESLGGVLTSSPGTVSGSANRIDVFVRGVDNALWTRTWSGSAWGSWSSLSGGLSSGPDVASWGASRLDVFARGTDKGLWHRTWNGSAWLAWESLGGVLTSDPSAISWGPNQIDVFVRGTNNGLWRRTLNGTTWSAWSSLGGGLTSAPDSGSCVSGHLDVFARGTDNGVWRRSFNGSSWEPWTAIGGHWTSGPGVVCKLGTSNFELFERGSDDALWQLELQS